MIFGLHWHFGHSRPLLHICPAIIGLLRGNYCTLWGLLWQLKQAYPPAPGPVTRHVPLHTSVYSAAESDALEESLAIWLHSLGLLEVEAALKRGAQPAAAFRDGLLGAGTAGEAQ